MKQASVALATSPQPRKLRVGIFADARLQPRWIVDGFARIASCEFAEVVMIGCGSADGNRAAAATPWLVRLYDKLDRAAFRAGPDPRQLADLAQVPHRTLIEPAPRSAAELVALDLDVAFALGEVDDRLLEGVAHYGVWRYFFGEQRDTAEQAAGFREVAEGRPLTGSGLQVRLSGAGTRLAYRSWSRTYPFSVARNRGKLLRKTSDFAYRALAELQRSGKGWLEQCKLVPEKRVVQVETTSSLGPIVARLAKRTVEKALHVEQWFLAYRLRESRFGDARAIPADLKGYTRLMPPRDRYWADPFVLARSDRYYVFFEELPFRTGKGVISVIEIDALGRTSAPVQVLERDYHLSYPFLVEHDGNLYMIPETAQNGTIECYRCVDFPTQWRLERVLLSDIRAVDATFHRGPDRWWMFANLGAGGDSFDDELNIFHADKLLGDWQPHRRNPVKSDTRSSRPAGQLYWKNGALYRPAQICSPLYGAGLSINRVMRLTTQDYAERQVERILPAQSEGLYGVHTVNRAGDLTVIDAFTRRRRF